MPEEKLSGQERTINLKITLGDDANPVAVNAQSGREAKPASLFTDEARLFDLVNLTTETVQKNTEHGLIPVQVVKFQYEDQRKKIIHLLAGNFSIFLARLLPYLRRLGASSDADIRKRAARTAAELMCDVDFIRVKEEVIIPWALADNPYINLNVSLTLSIVAQDDLYKENVKTLIRHWVSSPNPGFNWTGLLCCGQFGSLWPVDTLDLIEDSLRRERIDFLILASFVIDQLCSAGYGEDTLSYLSQWIRDKNVHAWIRTAAALIFLQTIQLETVLKSEGRSVDYAVELFKVGISDRRLTNSGVMRDAMLEKLKSWTESAFGDPEKQALMDILHQRLYMRSETPRDKERILFHLGKWRNKDHRFEQILNNLV